MSQVVAYKRLKRWKTLNRLRPPPPPSPKALAVGLLTRGSKFTGKPFGVLNWLSLKGGGRL